MSGGYGRALRGAGSFCALVAHKKTLTGLPVSVSPGGAAARRTQVAQRELAPTARSNAIDLASGASRRRAIRAREVDGNGVPACAARAKRAPAGVAGGLPCVPRHENFRAARGNFRGGLDEPPRRLVQCRWRASPAIDHGLSARPRAQTVVDGYFVPACRLLTATYIKVRYGNCIIII